MKARVNPDGTRTFYINNSEVIFKIFYIILSVLQNWNGKQTLIMKH